MGNTEFTASEDGANWKNAKQKFFGSLEFDPNTNPLTTVTDLIDLWNSSCKFFHAHVYYRDTTPHNERVHAEWMRSEIIKLAHSGKLSCDVGPLLDKPGNGPHTWSYFEVQFEVVDYGLLATWFQFNHKTNPVLFHPISVYHLENHTTRALWLGDKQPIKEEFLKRFDAEVVKGITDVFERCIKLQNDSEEGAEKYNQVREELAHLMYTHIVPSRYGISKD
jgi:aromatic ring-cleaving dioxygenase